LPVEVPVLPDDVVPPPKLKPLEPLEDVPPVLPPVVPPVVVPPLDEPDVPPLCPVPPA